jgi:hypothetical protein
MTMSERDRSRSPDPASEHHPADDHGAPSGDDHGAPSGDHGNGSGGGDGGNGEEVKLYVGNLDYRE